MPLHQVKIAEVIVNAIVFNPKNAEALRTMDLDDLLQSVPRLFDLFEERSIPYVLVGGIAMLVYVEGRNTQDIDLIVTPGAIDLLPELRVEEKKEEFGRVFFGELRLDLLFTDNRLFEKVRRDHSAVRRFADRDIPCATVEGLLLLKLFALPSLYRQAHFDRVEIYERDVTELIRQYKPDLAAILDELQSHVLDSDMQEIRKIVNEIEERIAQAPKRFPLNE